MCCRGSARARAGRGRSRQGRAGVPSRLLRVPADPTPPLPPRTELESLQDQITRTGYKSDLARAQILFGAKPLSRKRAPPSQAIQGRPRATIASRRLCASPSATSSCKRYPAARDGVQPYLEGARARPKRASSTLSALRGLGTATGVSLTARWSPIFPTAPGPRKRSTTSAPTTSSPTRTTSRRRPSRSCTRSFPSGPHAERAAWKYGWWAYTTGNYAETVRVFEKRGGELPALRLPAAVALLVGRAHEKMGEREHGRRAHAPGLHRLPELVLRPPGRARSCPRQGRDRDRARRRRAAPVSMPPAPPPRRRRRRRPRRSSASCSPPGSTTTR